MCTSEFFVRELGPNHLYTAAAGPSRRFESGWQKGRGQNIKAFQHMSSSLKNHNRHLSRYVTSHPGQLSLAIPLWVGTISTSQRAVMPCGWEVKAGMACVWVAGKTV